MNKNIEGLDEDVSGALAYLFGFITGIILLLVEKENKFVRFHAAQSTVVSGSFFVIYIILSILSSSMAFGYRGFLFNAVSLIASLLNLLIIILGFILWIYLIIMSYKGNKPRIPVFARIADTLI